METIADQVAIANPLEWRIENSGNIHGDDDLESGRFRFGTRLGQESVSVVPVFPADLDGLEGLKARSAALVKKQLRVSDPRLLKGILATPAPPGWSSAPGLGAHLPLLLDASGDVLASSVTARLDPALGLVVGELG